jgi:hypothetical protein
MAISIHNKNNAVLYGALKTMLNEKRNGTLYIRGTIHNNVK